MDAILAFFQIRIFLLKKSPVEALPLLPSYASVSVDEYASISLNMPKYP